MPPGPVNTCFWRDPQINPGPIDQLHQENNLAGPDTGVRILPVQDHRGAGRELKARVVIGGVRGPAKCQDETRS